MAVPLGMLLSTATLQGRTPVLRVTICEVADKPTDYDQKVVRVRALVSSDLMHATVLVDQTCDDVGFALDAADDPDDNRTRPIRLVKDRNYQRFEELHSQILQLREQHRQLYGTFEGVFEYHPGNNPNRMLVLGRVSNLYVGERDDPRYLTQGH